MSRHRASIVVDLYRIRCDQCKVALHDELATACPVCGATFDRIVSNHVGLAEQLERRREAAGVYTCRARPANPVWMPASRFAFGRQPEVVGIRRRPSPRRRFHLDN